MLPVMAARPREQSWADIHASVLSARLGDMWRQHTLSTANIQDAFARARFQQRQRRWNGGAPMMLTAPRPDPAIVPRRQRIPAANPTPFFPAHIMQIALNGCASR